MKNVQLLLIDPQNDFMDIPSDVCEIMGNATYKPDGSYTVEPFKPSLPVTGAWSDSIRLANFINRSEKMIKSISVTLDTHQQYDVAHPMFWINDQGQHPTPFTIISSNDVLQGNWKPFDTKIITRMVDYVQSLEKQGLFPLCIWPAHCLVGTTGNAIAQPIMNSLMAWENRLITRFAPVTKGHNPYTEHYGAFFAEVVDPKDPTTSLNTYLVEKLQKADLVFISGQALSHCVNRTVTQLADNFGEDNIKKLVLLIDTCSPVTGFEAAAQDFINRLTARGMRCVKTTDIQFKNNQIVLP